MKKFLFFLFFCLGFNSIISAQSTFGVSAESRHMVTCVITNMLYFSLEANENTDVSAQRQLIVNSNIPMNISVKETSTETFYTYIPALPEESHGPSITQIRAVTRVNYFTDHDTHYATSLLYTAAPM